MNPQTQEELLTFLQQAQENQLIDQETIDMLKGALQVSQMQVRDAMIPRPQMVVIDGYLTPQEALPQVIEAGHSRYPVTGEDRDEIVGSFISQRFIKIQFTRPLPLRPKSANWSGRRHLFLKANV